MNFFMCYKKNDKIYMHNWLNFLGGERGNEMAEVLMDFPEVG